MKKQAHDLPIAIIKQMLLLATGGFSLVAALAWNEVIKNFIDPFVKPYVSEGSGFVALWLCLSMQLPLRSLQLQSPIN